MGLLTDFFVASDEQLEAAFPAWVRPKPKRRKDGSGIPSRPFPDLGKSPRAIFKAEMAAMKKFPHAEFKSVDPVKLGLLQALLGVGDDDLGVTDQVLLANPEENDEWMVRLTDAFVQGLADLTKEQIKAASKSWSETEELEG